MKVFFVFSYVACAMNSLVFLVLPNKLVNVRITGFVLHCLC